MSTKQIKKRNMCSVEALCRCNGYIDFCEYGEPDELLVGVCIYFKHLPGNLYSRCDCITAKYEKEKELNYEPGMCRD